MYVCVCVCVCVCVAERANCHFLFAFVVVIVVVVKTVVTCMCVCTRVCGREISVVTACISAGVNLSAKHVHTQPWRGKAYQHNTHQYHTLALISKQSKRIKFAWTKIKY